MSENEHNLGKLRIIGCGCVSVMDLAANQRFLGLSRSRNGSREIYVLFFFFLEFTKLLYYSMK